MTESEHRLPRTVLPRHYRLTVDTDLGSETFDGSVTIEAEVIEATDRIVMSAVALDIGALSVRRDGSDLAHSWSLQPENERLVIVLDDATPAGAVSIGIDFSGRLDPQLEGFYPSSYTDESGTHTIGVTQFEAPFARKAFPCWDEPDFKAAFEISLVCAEDHLAISNSAAVAETHLGNGRRRIDFAPTITMSTYLVAWVIGRLEVSEEHQVGDTAIRVVARPGQRHLQDFALECATHALAWFEDYYGISYPGDKIDLVAIPDFAFGAMENLGCVTFRETLLLIDPAEASKAELERAATVIEHELAHMWFGDLVTMSWWNGIWLNEAFATFMEMAAADAFRPEWDIWTSFGISKTQAYDTDALFATRPIEYPVLTPRDAEGMFDILTYEKGASILRMFEQWMGATRFREGVRSYLRAHAYGNTETGDLWESLSAATDVDLVGAMESWIFTGGHPVVAVEARDDGVRLTQSPFTYLPATDPASPGESDDRRWSVPVRVRAGVGDDVVEAGGLLDGDTLDIGLGGRPQWVVANVDAAAFHRTQLPSDLQAGPAELSAAERLDAVDSLAALVTARRSDPAELVGLLRSFAPVVDEPAVWKKISGALGWFAQIGGPEAESPVASFVLDLVGDRVAGLDPSEIVEGEAGETRGVLARLAGTLGADPALIESARAILVADPGGLDPELVAAAPDIVAAHGDRADFDRLLSMYREAATPQNELRALSALGRFPDLDLVAGFCKLCLAEVRTQNAPYALAMTMANPVGGGAAWRFVAENWDAVNERFPSGSIIRMVGGTRSLRDVDAIEDAITFFDTHDVPQARTTLAQHMEHLRVNLGAIDAYRPRIPAALR